MATFPFLHGCPEGPDAHYVECGRKVDQLMTETALKYNRIQISIDKFGQENGDSRLTTTQCEQINVAVHESEMAAVPIMQFCGNDRYNEHFARHLTFPDAIERGIGKTANDINEKCPR